MRKAIIFLPLRRRSQSLSWNFCLRQPARCLLCSLPCCYILGNERKHTPNRCWKTWVLAGQ